MSNKNRLRQKDNDNTIKGIYVRGATSTKVHLLLIKSMCWSPRDNRPELVHGDPFTIYWN